MSLFSLAYDYTFSLFLLPLWSLHTHKDTQSVFLWFRIMKAQTEDTHVHLYTQTHKHTHTHTCTYTSPKGRRANKICWIDWLTHTHPPTHTHTHKSIVLSCNVILPQLLASSDWCNRKLVFMFFRKDGLSGGREEGVRRLQPWTDSSRPIRPEEGGEAWKKKEREAGGEIGSEVEDG